MLKLPPRPTRTTAPLKTRKGRGRAIPFLIIEQITQSPNVKLRRNRAAQRHPREPPFQSKSTKAMIRKGAIPGGSLKSGIMRSKKGLLNDELMKRNSEMSSELNTNMTIEITEWLAQAKHRAQEKFLQATNE